MTAAPFLFGGPGYIMAGLCDKSVHHDIVAEAPAHDEQVEDLVGTKMFMPGVEQRQLQGVDHTAQGVDDPAG